MTLGLLVDGRQNPLARLDEAVRLGFEAIALSFWEDTGNIDWGALAEGVRKRGLPVTALSVYGNPLAGDETSVRVARGWSVLVNEAWRFDAPVVSGFAGRVPGEPVPQSIEAWKRCFEPLAAAAAARKVTLAFETCRMGGTWKTGNWNIAYTPRAWELMEDALPLAWGLEWEPGHAVVGLADPLTQVKGWMHRIVHLHGKDAAVDQEALGRHGAFGGAETARYCLPGQGDTVWADVLAEIVACGYRGSLDLEMPSGPGQAHLTDLDLAASLRFLKALRPAT